MEAFRESVELFKVKVDFALEAYILGKRDYRMKVVECFSDLDLPFLGTTEEGEVEGGSASTEIEGVQEFGVTTVDILLSVEDIAEGTPALATFTAPPTPAGASLAEGASGPSTA